MADDTVKATVRITVKVTVDYDGYCDFFEPLLKNHAKSHSTL